MEEGKDQLFELTYIFNGSKYTCIAPMQTHRELLKKYNDGQY